MIKSQTRPDSGLGICGEHGGDPYLFELRHNVGLGLRRAALPSVSLIVRLAMLRLSIKNPRKALRER